MRLYVNTAIRLFYRKVSIVNFKRVPENNPVIFAPNHQNTLMDALVTCMSQKKQPSFLTRSDVFRNPLAAKFMYSLKMLPIYRIRDGADALQNNDEIFNKCVALLSENDSIIIFPEGSHNRKRVLRPVRKGILRIGFAAEEKNDFKSGTTIVPVGLNYWDHKAFRANLLIRYGEPIDLSDYAKKYQENPPKTMLEIIPELHTRLKNEIIHIQNTDYYDTYELIRELYRCKMIEKLKLKSKDLNHQFLADKKTISALDDCLNKEPETFQQLNASAKVFLEILRQLDLIPGNLKAKKDSSTLIFKIVIQTLGIPFWLTGIAINFLPYKLISIIVGKLKDDHWYSSIKMVVGMFLIPVFWLIEFLTMLIIFGNNPIAWIFLISIPIVSWMTVLLNENYKSIGSIFFAIKIRKNNLERWKEMQNQKVQIIEMMDAITERFL
jgi:1-acyl-sn-glycerol-3-phosphate acyltransferase